MIDEFKADLRALSSLQIIRKYIYDGGCFVLDRDQHLKLKEEISNRFGVGFGDVVLVGSGKLGFSIKSTKRFQPFGEDSDIDVAVASARLFEQVWHAAYLYKKSRADWPKSSAFFKYLAEGWIRPDMLPTNSSFEFTSHWWDFFEELSASRRFGSYKIRAGLYHSTFFLDEYQKICIEQCIEELD